MGLSFASSPLPKYMCVCLWFSAHQPQAPIATFARAIAGLLSNESLGFCYLAMGIKYLGQRQGTKIQNV